MKKEDLSAIAEKLRTIATQLEAASVGDESNVLNETEITMPMLQKLIAETARAGRIAEVQSILRAHGAAKASQVKPSDVVGVYDEIVALAAAYLDSS